MVLAFATAFTRRLTRDELERSSADELAAMVLGAFDLADRRSPEEVAVRVFSPTLERDGYQVPGTVLETNAADSPFLLDSINEELAARDLDVRSVIHPVVGVERDADGRIAKILHVREAASRESVMHFELERRLSEQERAELEETVRAILGDVRLVVRDFDGMKTAVRGMIDIAKGGAVLYPRDEVDETVAFLEWLLDLNFIFLGYREYTLMDPPEGRALVAVEGSGLGILSKTGWSTFEKPVLLASVDPNLRETDRGRGPPHLLEDEPPLDRAPSRPDGLHRGAARLPRRPDHRRGPDGRAVHVEGVHGAGRQHARAAPQAEADPGGGGPVRGLARLQGGRLDLRELPEGRAVRGDDGGAPPPDDGAALPAGVARHPTVRPPGPVRPERVAPGRDPEGPVQRRGSPAPAGAVPRTLPRDHGRLPPLAHRERARVPPLHRARPAGPDPDGPVRRARARGDRDRPHVGRPGARAPRGAERPRAWARAVRAVGGALPRVLQGLDPCRARGRGHRSVRRARPDRRAVPDRPAERGRGRRRPHPRPALQGRGPGGALGVRADPRVPRPARGGGAADRARGAGRAGVVPPRLRGPGRCDTGRSMSTARVPGSPSASRPCGGGPANRTP